MSRASDSPLVLFGAATVFVLCAAAAITWWGNRQGAGVERAFLVDVAHAVVVTRPLQVFGADRARLIAVDVATGQVTGVADDAGSFAHDLHVYGPAGGHVWFAATPQTWWSRPLDAIGTRVAHDWSSHPELGGGADARWLTPGGLVVRGRAGGEYLVSGAGDLTATEWSANVVRWQDHGADRDAYPRWRMSVALPDGVEVSSSVVPVESGGFVTRQDDSPVIVGGVAAVSVGGDLAEAPGAPRIDRVSAIGVAGALWTASTRTWFGTPQRWELRLKRLSVRVLALETGGEPEADLSVILRAHGGGLDELRFVRVEGRTGEVISAVPLGTVAAP